MAMDKVIRLRGSPHEQVQRLLPWYNSGTLESDERLLVEEHLFECAECRADAEADQRLASQISTLPLDVEHGWAVFGDPVELDGSTGESQVAGTGQVVSVPFWRRRVPVTWMVTGQAAALLLIFGAFTLRPEVPRVGTYHALGSAPVRATGNMIIVFEPETSEVRMRDALRSVGAHVVDGPNASGAYVLQVTDNRRAGAVDQLRAMHEVVLAEPIGGSSES
jgi:hypothetical protein